MTHLITGGAGFIGSHLVDYFMEEGEEVIVIDDLSAGDRRNFERWSDSKYFTFIRGDLLNSKSIYDVLPGCEVVFHLAANPEVRGWLAKPEDHFKQNVEGTYNLLEAVRRDGSADNFVFTSTSTVYGEPSLIPTPETYAPLKPISHYGASKLAAEALICSYADMYGFKCIIYRMANIVGPRSNHGVIYDFVEKLKKDSRELEVLGDGSQSKSYLYIDDCVEGMVLGVENSSEKVEILNIGSEDRIDVLTIANIVINEMELIDVEIRTTGGVEGGRGWKGDVKFMQLDMSRLRNLGWRPKWRSSDAVRLTAKSIVTSK